MHIISDIETECRAAWAQAEYDWGISRLNPHDPIDRAILLFKRAAEETRTLREEQRVRRLGQALSDALGELERAQKRRH